MPKAIIVGGGIAGLATGIAVTKGAIPAAMSEPRMRDMHTMPDYAAQIRRRG